LKPFAAPHFKAPSTLDLEKANGLDEIVGWVLATSQMNP
jgi:hypothetical protein